MICFDKENYVKNDLRLRLRLRLSQYSLFIYYTIWKKLMVFISFITRILKIKVNYFEVFSLIFFKFIVRCYPTLYIIHLFCMT